SREGLSSATIRNICAELESEGYLSHPHTSAGRVPTDKGYRYYVDNLMKSTKVSRTDAARINEILEEEAVTTPGKLMERTSILLSQLSGNVGIVIPPLVSQEMLHHIEFVKLADSRILVITVSSSGRVQDKVIRIDTEFAQDELNATARYLIDNFGGWTLFEIREEILRRMTEEKALYDTLLRNAVLLCSRSLQEGDQPDVFVEGASNIINKPDFADTERMKALFKMFEQKTRIIKILNQCIESANHDPVAVRIGSENSMTDMRSCTVIASGCFYNGSSTVAQIGVVGPTRLEYDRLISIVEYTARMCARLLAGKGFAVENRPHT
ncbi:MAG TPA: heat-inducible transcriptional repressor HrcA, partial [Blastocatellia bacterium]|nr:heat-inducible transcriptional repressor HrcA [Blastocatellia bacterium]